jgi:hypothetical protein
MRTNTTGSTDGTRQHSEKVRPRPPQTTNLAEETSPSIATTSAVSTLAEQAYDATNEVVMSINNTKTGSVERSIFLCFRCRFLIHVDCFIRSEAPFLAFLS